MNTHLPQHMQEAVITLASLEAEQSVLGALLLDDSAFDRIQGLEPRAFFDPAHRLIFEAVIALAREGKAFDIVTTSDRLESHGHLAKIGGLAYLATLAQNTPSAANIRRYAEIVKTRHAERQMQSAGNFIRQIATERDRSLADRQAEAMRLLEDITDTCTGHPTEVTAAEAAKALLDSVDERSTRPDGALGGLSTGLAALDQQLDGLHRGELVVIGGRPSMGKSCVGELVARTNAKHGANVRYVSYEMPSSDILARTAAAEADIPLEHIRKGRMTDDEWTRLTSFVGLPSEWRLTIDDSSSTTVEQIAARARAQKRRGGLDLLIIDHLHLIPRSGRNEVAELGEITAALKRLARELNIPVVLLAQLSRASATNGGRAPTLADLRGSGSIEQDADAVIFVHRQAYYDEQANPGEAELIIGKQRNGPVGSVRVGWRGDLVRFQDLIPNNWSPPIKRRSTNNFDL